MLRIEGGLFFANAEPVAREIRGTAKRADVLVSPVHGESRPLRLADLVAQLRVERVPLRLRVAGEWQDSVSGET